MVRREWLCSCASGECMSERIAIIAALPREVAALVKGFEVHKAHQHRGVYVWTSPQAIVVAAGMGPARAAFAVEAALAEGPVSELLSIGLAGACDPALPVGSVLEATEVVDVRSGEHFKTSAEQDARAVLATGPGIAGVREKARLHASYGAVAVDMEAATVARLALAHGIPFRALKAISDGHLFEMEDMGHFETRHGHFHTRAFALHTAVRPHTWAKTIKLGKHSAQALRALTTVLQSEIAR